MKIEPRVTNPASALLTTIFLCAAFVAPATAQQAQGTLVQTIDAWLFSPPSPDTAGATYLSDADTILLSDSEVNEIPALFTGDNLFEAGFTGNLIQTGSLITHTNEPTGVGYNSINTHIFISDDNRKEIYELDPGSDTLYGTDDDICYPALVPK